MRRAAVLVLAALMTVVLLGGGPAAAESAEVDTPSHATELSQSAAIGGGAQSEETAEARLVQPCAVASPEGFSDPEGDAIGWVEGYWYDEPVEVDQSDGINETELDALAARTAARVEALRCLQFEELPPIELRSREEFVEEQAGLFGSVEREERLFDNAKLETLLMVPSEVDSFELREENRGTAALGLYDPIAGEVVLVSDAEGELRVDELLLAHELGHALQDQHFDLARYDATLTDRALAEDALIEGDVYRIEQRYEEACLNGSWEGTCQRPGDELEPADEPANWGLYFTTYQPYSDGPDFVDELYERRGNWSTIDAAYDDPPTTTRHVLYPETYPDYEPRNVTIEGTASEDWERLSVPGRQDHERVGQAAIASAFMAPAVESDGGEWTYDHEEVYGDPLNYDYDATRGWDGDRLHVYVDEDDDTAAVWRVAWEDEEAAETFHTRYVELLAYRGAEPVDDRVGTFSFGNAPEWSGAAYVAREGNVTTVVHAPSVAELSEVREGAAPEVEETPPQHPGMPDGVEFSDAPPPQNVSRDEPDETPGMGPLAAVLALALALMALRRR